MSSLNPFHLAIPVKEITETRYFYRDILGCEEGRSSDHWVDFNFFGHQLVLHIDSSKANILNENSVDGKSVPVPHFGIVLDWDVFENFEKKIRNKVKQKLNTFVKYFTVTFMSASILCNKVIKIIYYTLKTVFK